MAVMSAVSDDGHAQVVYQPTVYAGSASESPPDAPSQRVDANTVDSPFAGVGSLKVVNAAGTVRGSAVAITPLHILTAAHLLDGNSDGQIDAQPQGITFNLNVGGNLTHEIHGTAALIHPDFTGFLSPSLNDDLAIVVLDTPLPMDLPTYSLYGQPIDLGTEITLVGYGRSGYGDTGQTDGSSFTVKRSGDNVIDVLAPDDDPGGLATDETFFYDFDGPPGTLNMMGGPTLGNDIETIIAPGDSGGPSFVRQGDQYMLAGINTFIGHYTSLFTTVAGGIALPAYHDWLTENVFLLPGDANFDGAVDVMDLAIIAMNYGDDTCVLWQSGDFNSDGVVSLTDLATFGTNMGSVAEYALFGQGAEAGGSGTSGAGSGEGSVFSVGDPGSSIPAPLGIAALPLWLLSACRRPRRG